MFFHYLDNIRFFIHSKNQNKWQKIMTFNIYKKQLAQFLVIYSLVLLGIFNLNSAYAMYTNGGEAHFYPDDDYPIQYGILIPDPNMYATMSVQGSDQGEFTLMDWLGLTIDSEAVIGEDISELYPWYFDTPLTPTITDNNHIDPWNDITWLNVTAYKSENNTISPFTLNTVFDYYIMKEKKTLSVPLDRTLPMQIDIIISSTGPKILKFDWLADDPSAINYDRYLISPSGKLVDLDERTATSHAISPPIDVFNYLIFNAKEKGTYRLLIYATHNEPAYLFLEFLSSTISTLPMDTIMFGGNGGDILTIDESVHSNWQSIWFKFKGNKGDIYRLDLSKDYSTGIEPIIDLWIPCQAGYILDENILTGSHEVYFPESSNAYISFTDTGYGDWYRYSLFVSEIEAFDYNIGQNLTKYRVLSDEIITIEFEIQEDSFIRFNYSSLADPAGQPYIKALETANAFIFRDSKNLQSFDEITPLLTTTIDSEDFNYYYMPTGIYKAIIKNNNPNEDGAFHISSKLIEWADENIPINSLTYPNNSPSQFTSLEFEPDVYYDNLKQGIGIDINISEPGQYRLNVTVLNSENLTITPNPGRPSAVVVYNSSQGTYHNWTTEVLDPLKSFPAFSDDEPSEQTDDILFIAYSQKWSDMNFNFSQLGVKDSPALDLSFMTYDGTDFTNEVSETLDTTYEFTSNGNISLNIEDGDYIDWIKGADFDVININENDSYWLGIKLNSKDYSTLPYIQSITILNETQAPSETILGNLNFALVRDTGYDYGDYWIPSDQPSVAQIVSDSFESFLIEADSPYLMGFEEGIYKLLVIPEVESDDPFMIKVAVENFWSYKQQITYNITSEPNLYQYQINNYTDSGYAYDNGTLHHFNLTTTYNHLKSTPTDLGQDSYFVIECFGQAYQWTQLVVACENVTQYNLYLAQNLPWIDNDGPNSEITMLTPFTPGTTVSTYEFGIFNDHFYLIFQTLASEDWITYKIDLNQYNTIQLLAKAEVASQEPEIPMALILGIAIGIPVTAGIIVVIYVLKRRGRILSKTPNY